MAKLHESHSSELNARLAKTGDKVRSEQAAKRHEKASCYYAH